MNSSPVPDPRISVVMCTRHRAHSVGQAVESVLANTHSSFDFTIVDQSTDDATGSIIRAIADSDPRLHYVHVEQAGLSRAYNTGIRATTAPLLAFTDDDCLVPTDWLEKIEAAFEAERGGELLYGQVIPAGHGSDDFELTPFVEIKAPRRLGPDDGFEVFGMGANFAARRTLFDKIGYFDEVLGGGGPLRSSQDFDLTYRAYRGGAITLLRPEVMLRHDGRREAADWPALLSNYGFGDGAFYMKHIRCRDPQAVWLFTRRLTRTVLSSIKHWSPGKGRDQYRAGLFRGARASFDFDVDRRRRLYVPR